MKKNAVALRAITHADDSFAKGDVILGMAAGHFNDWSAPGVELVREATAAEVAKAKGEPAKAAAKPKRVRKTKAASIKAPAPAPEQPSDIAAAPNSDA